MCCRRKLTTTCHQHRPQPHLFLCKPVLFFFCPFSLVFIQQGLSGGHCARWRSSTRQHTILHVNPAQLPQAAGLLESLPSCLCISEVPEEHIRVQALPLAVLCKICRLLQAALVARVMRSSRIGHGWLMLLSWCFRPTLLRGLVDLAMSSAHRTRRGGESNLWSLENRDAWHARPDCHKRSLTSRKASSRVSLSNSYAHIYRT